MHLVPSRLLVSQSALWCRQCLFLFRSLANPLIYRAFPELHAIILLYTCIWDVNHEKAGMQRANAQARAGPPEPVRLVRQKPDHFFLHSPLYGIDRQIIVLGNDRQACISSISVC